MGPGDRSWRITGAASSPGTKTLERAAALGMPVRVIDSSGAELIVVGRTDLDLAADPPIIAATSQVSATPWAWP
jgi:hypothetical protein